MTKSSAHNQLIAEAAQLLHKAGRETSALNLLDHIRGSDLNLPTLRIFSELASQNEQAVRPLPQDQSGFGTVTRDRPRCMTVLDPISELNWSTDFWGKRFVRAQAIAEGLAADVGDELPWFVSPTA